MSISYYNAGVFLDKRHNRIRKNRVRINNVTTFPECRSSRRWAGVAMGGAGRAVTRCRAGEHRLPPPVAVSPSGSPPGPRCRRGRPGKCGAASGSAGGAAAGNGGGEWSGVLRLGPSRRPQRCVARGPLLVLAERGLVMRGSLFGEIFFGNALILTSRSSKITHERDLGTDSCCGKMEA